MSSDGSGGAGGASGNSVKDWADSIKATVDAIKAVQDLLSSPRSVIIEVDNATGRTTPGITLLQIASQHDHGGFAKTPSSVIGPKSSDAYGSQSTGFATGTEGSVTYDGGNGMQLKVYWDNPFIGGNSSAATLSGKHTKRYSTLTDTGSGNQDANMRYVVLDMQDFNNGAWSVRSLLPGGLDASHGLRSLRSDRAQTSLRDILGL